MRSTKEQRRRHLWSVLCHSGRPTNDEHDGNVASFTFCANILFEQVNSVALQFVHYCLSKRVRPSGVAKDLVTQMKTLSMLGLMRATLQRFLVQSTFAVVRQDGVVAFVDSQFTTFLHIS